MSAREVADELERIVFSGEAAKGLAFVAIVGTICFLAISGRPIPVELMTIASAIVGYYFRGGPRGRQDNN